MLEQVKSGGNVASKRAPIHIVEQIALRKPLSFSFSKLLLIFAAIAKLLGKQQQQQ